MAIQTIPADSTQLLDAAIYKLSVLKAMLSMTYGMNYENFTALTAEAKDAMMAGCFDVAHDAGTLLSGLRDAPTGTPQPGQA